MGGDRGMIDWYEEGEDRESWRRSAGVSNVIGEVIRGLHVRRLDILPRLSLR
jgi:hypothetical protein